MSLKLARVAAGRDHGTVSFVRRKAVGDLRRPRTRRGGRRSRRAARRGEVREGKKRLRLKVSKLVGDGAAVLVYEPSA